MTSMVSRAIALLLVTGLTAASCTGAPTVRETTTTDSIQTPSTTISVETLGIQDLEFDEFLESSYALLAIRDPQGLSSAGVAGSYGLRNDRLNNLSDSFIRETQAIEAAILGELRRFDRESLDLDQRVSYDGYEWYLQHQVDGHRFMYHDWPVHHLVNSYNFNLILFLTDQHAVESIADAEDYIARLRQIDRQVGEVIDGLQRRVAAGVLPVGEIVTMTVQRLQRDVGGAASAEGIDVSGLELYATFEDKLHQAGILPDEAARLLAESRDALETSFLPAWLALAEYMRSLQHLASDRAGVVRHPEGEAYYSHLLRGQTSTDLTPLEVHNLGLEQVARVSSELREAFNELGYSAQESIATLLQRAAREAGSVAGPEAIALNEALIEEAERVFRPWFELWPPHPVQVVADPAGGGYYTAGSIDGSRPGSFYAGTNQRSLLSVRTINYHEAVPGHHTQIGIAQSLDLPSFQNFVTHNGYVEGWALYAERLAAEAGMYEEDPYGNIGRLQLELLRAVRLVVDTGIHHLGWSSSEARAYMNSVIPAWSHEVERYMVLPGQATGYMVGMQEILRLRRLAMDALGEDFDLAEFHSVVLGSGSQPLEVLDRIVAEFAGRSDG